VIREMDSVPIVDDEQLHEYLACLEGRSQQGVQQALEKLEASGVDIPRLLTKRYSISRRWADRALCVSQCIRYAASNEDAYQLGIRALDDRSRSVRRIACSLLASARRFEAILQIETLLSDELTREDAKAAIFELEQFNTN
jgi:hypothetical protein